MEVRVREVRDNCGPIKVIQGPRYGMSGLFPETFSNFRVFTLGRATCSPPPPCGMRHGNLCPKDYQSQLCIRRVTVDWVLVRVSWEHLGFEPGSG